MRVGVLALQGGFAPHLQALKKLGHEAVAVRTASEVRGVDGLVLPGGESTTQLELIRRGRLEEALREHGALHKPLLATCAGVILCAKGVSQPQQPSLGLIDIDVVRNAYGRQVQSFEARGASGFPLVFIRAPRIVACGPGVEVIERFDGDPIWVRQGAACGVTFHPELTDDLGVHRQVFGSG